jgi:hypothetical protein
MIIALLKKCSKVVEYALLYFFIGLLWLYFAFKKLQ